MRWEILILECIICLSGEQEPEEPVVVRYDAQHVVDERNFIFTYTCVLE